MKKIILVLIALGFILGACGKSMFLLEQCREVTDTKKECMTTTVKGDSDLLSY